MKSFLLSVAFLFILCSCTYIPTHNFMIGERYAAIVPEKVLFFKGPSNSTEPFRMEKPEEFVIEGVECTIRTEKGDCPFDFNIRSGMPNNACDVFYRVGLEEEGTAYLSALYIFSQKISGFLLPLGPKREQSWGDDTFEVRAGFDEMWDIVIRAVHDLGYTIAQVRKEDGYLSTHTQDEGEFRSRMAIWLTMNGDYARVEVDATSEQRYRTKDKITGEVHVSWYGGGKSRYYQYQFLDKIRQRLWASYKEAKK